jgi:hypothetical protein
MRWRGPNRTHAAAFTTHPHLPPTDSQPNRTNRRTNPTDNVGDNVGDIAGMGADLFGSFAESTCAALVVSAVSSLGKTHDWNGARAGGRLGEGVGGRQGGKGWWRLVVVWVV